MCEADAKAAGIGRRKMRSTRRAYLRVRGSNSSAL